MLHNLHAQQQPQTERSKISEFEGFSCKGFLISGCCVLLGLAKVRRYRVHLVNALCSCILFSVSCTWHLEVTLVH